MVPFDPDAALRRQIERTDAWRKKYLKAKSERDEALEVLRLLLLCEDPRRPCACRDCPTCQARSLLP